MEKSDNFGYFILIIWPCLSSIVNSVDPQEVPDYYEIVKEPMDLETVRDGVDSGKYSSWGQFLDDIVLMRK